MKVNHKSVLMGVSVLLICAGSSFGSSPAEEDDHGAVVKLYFEEVWSQGKLETAHQIIAPSYQFHSPMMRIVGPTGPDLVTGQVEMRREAFPDLKMTIADLLVQGDRVAVRWKAEGTHDGPLGVPGIHLPARFHQSSMPTTRNTHPSQAVAFMTALSVREYTSWPSRVICQPQENVGRAPAVGVGCIFQLLKVIAGENSRPAPA